MRMELTNVSAELKTSTTQLENLKKEKQALTTELEEKKAQLEEQGEKKDTIISKLRALAKKYKGIGAVIYRIKKCNLNLFSAPPPSS